MNAADGRFQLVRDVLRQLALDTAFFFLLRDVVDRQFVAIIEKEDALDKEYLPVFVNRDGFAQDFAFPVGIGDVAAQEIANRF